MSEWDINIDDGKGNVRQLRLFGVSTEEEARLAADRFAARWDGSQIVSVDRVLGTAGSGGMVYTLTGVVTPT